MIGLADGPLCLIVSGTWSLTRCFSSLTVSSLRVWSIQAVIRRVRHLKVCCKIWWQNIVRVLFVAHFALLLNFNASSFRSSQLCDLLSTTLFVSLIHLFIFLYRILRRLNDFVSLTGHCCRHSIPINSNSFIIKRLSIVHLDVYNLLLLLFFYLTRPRVERAITCLLP